MAVLDLDAVLQQDAEAPKRRLKEARDAFAGPDLARAAGLQGEGPDSAAKNKVLAVLRRAMKAAEAGDDAGAAKLALKALDVDPDSAVANHVLAMMLDRLGHLSKSLEMYERAWRLDPTDARVYYNLGIVAWKLDMLDAAEKFYRVALDMEPGSTDATVNLAGVLRDKGRFAEAVELLRSAVYADESNHVLWNALGTVLLESGDPEQAKTFYLETLRLDPAFSRGWHNLAYADGLLGDEAAAILAFDKALKNPAAASDRAQMLHGRALSRLALGDLHGGWADYDVRLSPDYSAGTVFLMQVPRWDGLDSVAGKRLLLVGEQGLGDEVLFLSAAPDLIAELGDASRLTIACERRLASLVARSFPGVDVITHATINKEGRNLRALPEVKDWSAFDLWAPMASPLRRLRPDAETFPDRTSFFVPDSDRVREIRAQLDALPAGPKVGLCWKSKLMTAKRAKYFSPFEQWRPVLETPGVTFVNMQYGDVDAELARAADEIGVTIHPIPGLDLMQDLEGVTAAGAALDLFIGPMNASTNLAAAAGGAVWFVSGKHHWPLLGTGRLPWYPTARVYSPPEFNAWDAAMADIRAALEADAADRLAA